MKSEVVETEPDYESEFLQLVMGLQSSGWMLLGKIANPITGKEERNLEGAKATIDVLMMLKQKTKGNLSRAEQSLLDGAIQQLQINYVDELNKKNAEEPQKVYQGEEQKAEVDKEESTENSESGKTKATRAEKEKEPSSKTKKSAKTKTKE